MSPTVLSEEGCRVMIYPNDHLPAHVHVKQVEKDARVRLDPVTDRPVAVTFHDGKVWVTLADGRVIGNPLDWHPWLAEATPEQRANFELRAFSVDWPDLDEGLDIEGMLRGIRPRAKTAEIEEARV